MPMPMAIPLVVHVRPLVLLVCPGTGGQDTKGISVQVSSSSSSSSSSGSGSRRVVFAEVESSNGNNSRCRSNRRGRDG